MEFIMKRLLCLLLCAALLIPMLVSCSRPPEFSEIRDRLEELIEESYGVNELLFGKGPEVYERVYEPDISVYKDERPDKTYYYYYYNIEDETLGTVTAYRLTTAVGLDYSYVIAKETLSDGEEYVYHDEESGKYYVRTDYEEEKYDFYYDRSMPENYDAVKLDNEHALSVESIKAYAASVYSADYIESVSEMLFTGAAVSESSSGILEARYIDYADEDGNTWLMMSNKYEPLINSKRIYDLSTAEIVKPSNANYVNVRIDSHLENDPDNILSVRLSLILQDGVWMLDNATY